METPLPPTLVTVLKRAFSLRPGPGSSWPLVVWSFRNILLRPKRTPLLLAFLLIPLGMTLLISGALDNYSSSSAEVTSAQGGRAWFQDLMSAVFFPLLIPIVTAAFATSVLGEEVEGKTLPYLFTRPVYRSWTLLAKSLSSFVAAALLGVLALTLTYFVAVGFTENPLDRIHELFGYWFAIALTVLATGGTFLALGVLWRHAMILIVIYTFLWETLLSTLLPASVLQLSFVWYERAYINDFLGREAGFITQLLVDVPTAGEAVAVLLFSGILGFLSALVIVSYRDYNV